MINTRVQATQRRLQESTIFAHEGTRQDGQCPTHERGRNQQDQCRPPKAERHARSAAERQRAGGADIHPVRETEDQRREDAKNANRNLEPAVENRRSCRAVRTPPEQPGAQAEAAHIGGDDGRDGLDGGTEGLIENANPEQLVDQTGRTRQKEQKAICEGRLRTHAARALPARGPLPVEGCSPRDWVRTRRTCRSTPRASPARRARGSSDRRSGPQSRRRTPMRRRPRMRRSLYSSSESTPRSSPSPPATASADRSPLR